MNLQPGEAAVDSERVWACVPVYNNAATVANVVSRCRSQLKHVVVVDDGSSDIDVSDALKDLDVIVLKHPVNQGKGAALLTGFDYIREQGGHYAITLDSDGQHDPADIPAFLPHLQPHTLILGRRHLVQGHMPASSLIGREFSDFWVELETGVKACDTQSGFRAYPLQAIAELKLATRHYNFEVEAVTRSIWAGLLVRDVPISVWYPDAKDRVSSFDQVKDNARLALLHARLALRQLWLWPHVKIVKTERKQTRPWWKQNHLPFALAIVAAMSTAVPMMHGYVGALAILFLAWRWHFNALAVVGGLLLGLGIFSQREVLLETFLGWSWFSLSHAMAVFVSVFVGVLVMVASRKCQPLDTTLRRDS